MPGRFQSWTSLICGLLLSASAAWCAEISGFVVDPLGQPVANAPVHLLGGITSRAAHTDERGRFRFTAPDAAWYTLVAVVPGFAARPRKIAASEAASVELRLELAARSETVVVTAERAEAPASAVASSVTVITRQQLEQTHAESLADALRGVPGMNVVQTGRRGSTATVFARGANSNSNLVLIDGVPVNDFGGFFNFAHIPVESIERIEVVRGPQSALYGLNAIGAVVHVITHRGSPEGGAAFQARGQIEGGSFGTVRGSVGAGGRSGRFAWNAGLMRLNTDGVVPNDDYRNEAASLRLEFMPTAATALRYTLLADANEIGSPGPYTVAPVDTVSRGKQNTYVNGLEFEWQRGRVRQKLAGSLFVDRLGFESPFGPSFSRQLRGTAATETHVSLGESDVLAFGFDFQRERIRNTFITDAQFADFPLRRNSYGWFVENRYERGGRFFVNAGLRVEAIRTADLPADAWGSRPPTAARTNSAVSPKVSAALLNRPGGGAKFHASAGTGFRAPDGFELAFTDNPGLRPERTTSFDAGVEQQFFGRRAVIDLTYFHTRFHDLIVTVTGSLADVSRFQSDNVANSRAQGLELSGTVRPHDSVTINAHYTWMKTEVLSLDGAPGRALAPFRVGDPLLRRPAHSAAWMLTWHVPRLPLTLHSGAVARSSVLDVDPLFGLFGGVLENPGYVRPDAGMELALSREIVLFARLHNFTDRRYEEALGFPSLRRNFVAGLKFRWR